MVNLMGIKKFYVQQLDEADCGAAALAMLFKFYGSDISLSAIRNVAQTDKSGTSALGMIKAAENFDFETKAIRADKSLFESNINEIPVPFVAHVNKNNGFLHYVVVFKVTKKYLLIADPDPIDGIKKVTYPDFFNIWTCVTLFMFPNSAYEPSNDDKDSLWNTFKILLKQKSTILTIIAATFLTTLITIFGAFFLQQLIDNYVPNGLKTTLNSVSLGLVIAYIFHGIFIYIEGYLSIVLSQKLSIDILLYYIRHLFKLPISFFNSRKTGEITSRFSDANNIINTLSQTAISTVLNVGTIFFVGIALAMISLKLFFIALITFPVYTAIIYAFFNQFDKLNNDRMEQNAILSSELIENIRGMESIKSLGVEIPKYQHIDHEFSSFLKINYRYGKLTVFQSAIKDIFQLLITLSILYFGSVMAINGQISIGQLVAFNALLGYFMNPIVSIISLQNDLQTARTANSRLNQVLLVSPENNDSEERISLSNTEKLNIEISKVSFEYKYEQEILHKISLKIKSGESVAVVGLSGSGKTTLAKLLVKFYNPTKGNIFINNHDLSTIGNEEIRANIKYLPQTPYIFSGSVLDNIRLGSKDSLSMTEVRRAAKIAEIDDFISSLPNGYETILSEDAGLSGGQLQRLAIARTLLSDAKVLIFDESTSNLDLLTEQKILNNLLAIKGKTMIFIAHRLEIAKKVNHIIVMEKGEVLEEGTHQQLIDKKGRYYDLWEE